MRVQQWARGVPWTSDATVCTGGAINTGPGAAGFESYAYYWSSSEYSATDVWGYSFSIYSQSVGDKWRTIYYVRPVRAF